MVMERLQHEGEGILLIFDNVIDADAVKPYLPRGGSAQVIVTSNAPAWRAVAEPLEIAIWPKHIGADYLMKRTGRKEERAAAEDLSETLGGLPLAHEQAAAYCERLEIPIAEYHSRFMATPVDMLDTVRDAPSEYHDKRTVARTFALAIDEAGKLHPAAEPLLLHAALLAPEPIPLFLFAEAREQLGEPLGAALPLDGLDEALAALRTFALVDRETIVDVRDPTILTEMIRLHRLVREIAAARPPHNAREQSRRALIEALRVVYPLEVFNNPKTWSRARLLDAIALGLVFGSRGPPIGAEESVSYLLDRLASYRHSALGAYAQARPLYERALVVSETLGPEHPFPAAFHNNLGMLLRTQGDLAGAKPHLKQALAMRKKLLPLHHPDIGVSLGNLGELLRAQADILQERGDLDAAQPLFECAQPLLQQALTIAEKAFGPEHELIAEVGDGMQG
jgi:tetratricopeptide (TPR) repeat protein